MPLVKEDELKKQIKAKNLACCYFLYGEEKFLVRRYAELLADQAVGKERDGFNFQQFDGAGGDIDAIAAAVEALPLMAQRKCVWVNDLDVESLSATQNAKLEELLSDLPDTCLLLFCQATLEIDGKRSAKWRKFLTLAQKHCQVVELGKRGAIALEKQLVDWAAKRGCTLSRILAGRVIQLCGDDLLTLRAELERLCAYAQDREITQEDVDTVVTQNLETTVFVLAKALMAREYGRAYRQLDLLLYQKEEPVAILAVLASSYVDLYRVRVAEESGESLSALSRDFDYKNKEFRLRNAQRDGRRLSTPAIKKSLELLLEADVQLKSARGDRRVVLEKLIAQLLLAAEGGAAS